MLMVTISGVRGIVGETLTPYVVMKYVHAFGKLQKESGLGRKVVVGRDSRVSGPWITDIACGVLASLGFEVIQLGIVPTPTVQIMVQQLKADAGLVITSSHNPVQWNGLKFIDNTGLFLGPEKCKTMFAMADKSTFDIPDYTATGRRVDDHTAIETHIRLVDGLDCVDVEKIRSKKFRVCLDTVNGAGGPIMTTLLKQFGCEVVELNTDPTGLFAHTPEPIPENLTDLCKAVVEQKCDLGIAVDPDVDRCVFINEKGEPIGEEYTLTMAVELFLGVLGKRGAVVKNLSSTKAINEVAAKYGCETFSAPVGEINVGEKMVAVGAVIGGEGNGGVMLPDLHIGRDAPCAAAMALSLLAHRGLSMSALKASLPQWHITKLKVPLGSVNPDQVLAHFKQEWAAKASDISEEDGLRIDTPDWWVHIRKSNTEPIVRVIGEGRTLEESQKICQDFMDQIQKM
eukprot:GCRY01001430.1.p2 GENE.GCRY01001430.1~~GCRY01001430.1.p2  ORF type:complete len:456 (-),score=111.85 GCRY01001430.1:47-1414(-)